MLRIAAPAFSRIRVAVARRSARTHVDRDDDGGRRCRLPATQRGDAPHRPAARTAHAAHRRAGLHASPIATWVGEAQAGPRTSACRPRSRSCRAVISRAGISLAAGRRQRRSTADLELGGFRVAAEGQPVAPLPAVDPLPPDVGLSRGSSAPRRPSTCSRISRPRRAHLFDVPISLSDDASASCARRCIRASRWPALARAVISTGRRRPASRRRRACTPVGIETVMAAPSFPQPMYEPLRELSQDLLLPGLDKVLPDTRARPARPTARSSKPTWSGSTSRWDASCCGAAFRPISAAPTSSTSGAATRAVAAAATSTISARTWARALGTAPRRPRRREQFVMLLRSSLLRRYPNAIIYLTPALDRRRRRQRRPPPDVLPVFNGAMEPDVNFFGFPITPAASGRWFGTSPGYYVVIQEHPTEPRFGLDVGHRRSARQEPPRRRHAAAGRRAARTGCTWGRNARAHGRHHAPAAGSHRDSRLATRLR